MSSSTILEDDFDEKRPPVSRPDLVRLESNVDKAIDAEANINITSSDDTQDADDDPGPPPNGGWLAWLQVLGSFFLFFNSWYVYANSVDISATDHTLGGL